MSFRLFLRIFVLPGAGQVVTGRQWPPGDPGGSAEVLSREGAVREGSGRAGAEDAAAAGRRLCPSQPLVLRPPGPGEGRLPFPVPSHSSCSLFTDSLRNISSAPHGPRSSPAELSSSSQHLLRERKASAPSHSSQPTLFTFEPALSNHVQPALSASAPQEYLYLHQCISRRAESTR